MCNPLVNIANSSSTRPTSVLSKFDETDLYYKFTAFAVATGICCFLIRQNYIREYITTTNNEQTMIELLSLRTLNGMYTHLREGAIFSHIYVSEKMHYENV